MRFFHSNNLFFICHDSYFPCSEYKGQKKRPLSFTNDLINEYGPIYCNTPDNPVYILEPWSRGIGGRLNGKTKLVLVVLVYSSVLCHVMEEETFEE